jgi:hypothetical protein
MLKDHLQKIET